MEWTPTLQDREGPLYQQIVEALAADVANGRLHRGQQLPTHRALAKSARHRPDHRHARLRGGAGNAASPKRGSAQGTFVAEKHVAARAGPARRGRSSTLDELAAAAPMEADLEGRITRGLAAIAARSGSRLSATAHLAEPEGSEAERVHAAPGSAALAASSMRMASGW